MKPSRPDPGDSSEPDEAGADARVVQRAISNLRDRVRVQDDEIDTVRAMIRVLQNHGAGDQVAQVQARMEAMEAEVRQSLVESQVDQTERTRREVMPRIQVLEAEAAEMREVMGRTDANLQRLLTEIERLLIEVARRPEPGAFVGAAPAAVAATAEIAPPLFEAEPDEARFRWRVPAMVLFVLIVLFLAGWGLTTMIRGTGRSGAATDSTSSLSPVEQGRVYESQKNYAKAEAIYKDVLKKDPGNNEVIRRLAGVLFLEDKLEESAAELNKLSGAKSTSP